MKIIGWHLEEVGTANTPAKFWGIRWIQSGVDGDYILYVYQSCKLGATGTRTKGLRVCITLNEDIVVTGGDGTSAYPYTIK